MKDQHQMKRYYLSPQAIPTGVAVEQSLLVGTVRMQLWVDELENINADLNDGTGSDQRAGSDMYFEF